MEPTTAFNISRIVLILAGVFTAAGGIGVLYYGNILSTTQNIQIEESKSQASIAKQKAAEAQAKAASANENTKTLELKVAAAKEDTEQAKLETSKINLKAEKATRDAKKAMAQAESAKLEREKLYQQTLILEKENASLKIESDRVKSFTINLALLIQDDGSFDNFAIHSLNGAVGFIYLAEKEKNRKYSFIVEQPYRIEKRPDGKILLRANFVPYNSDKLYTTSLQSLESIKYLYLDLGKRIEEHKITPISPMEIHMAFSINEVKFSEPIYRENGLNTMKNGLPLAIKVDKEFRSISSSFKETTNNND